MLIEQEIVEQNTETMEPVAAPDPVEQRKQDNLVQMRLKLEAAEREAKRAKAEAEQYMRNKPMPSNPTPESEDAWDIDDEEYVQAKVVKKVTRKALDEAKKTRTEIEELRNELKIVRAEKATEKLTNFNSVVNDENLATLQRLYPDDFETMMSNPNLKSKSVTAYNMLINYGIAEDNKKEGEKMKSVERKIEENKTKPGSAATAKVSSSPLTQASRYDSDGRLWLKEDDINRINQSVRMKLGLG